MIYLRVNRVVSAAARDKDVLVGWYYVDQVPNVGESINLRGDPYLLVERGWALTGRHENCPTEGGTREQYCYARVVKNGEF